MEHVVFFPGPDGAPAFRRLPTLEEAVGLVEHLRNEVQVADVSLHALTEVPLAFRAYYRVEVAAPAPAPSVPVAEPVAPQGQPVGEQVPAQAEAPAVEAVPETALSQSVSETAPETGGARARVRDGGLGFFAS